VEANMTMTANTLKTQNTSAGQQLFEAMRAGSRAIWISNGLMLACAVAAVAMQFVDAREVNGVNAWIKPAKFFVSLAIQFGTVALALYLLPAVERGARSMTIAIALMLGWGWLEMAYLVFRAARAEASHFNVATPIDAAAYGLMGIGAVSMTVIGGYVGYRLWQRRRAGLWHEALGLGLMLGALLGTVAGAYMSAQTGHGVGGDPTDATGTGLFGWSTTGGDLRVAHFVGLHAAQIVPLVALGGRRWMVWGAAAACTFVTVGVFVMAVLGVPLLRV
jgi:hypothetical protein